MEQTDIQDIIKESLNILKEKVVVALQNDDAEEVDQAIIATVGSLAQMVAGLEQLAFDAGRLQEDDGSFVFDDFNDFQNS